MCLWVIGDYVLDLTIEIDLRDVRFPGDQGSDHIRIDGDCLVVPTGHHIVVDLLGNQLDFVVRVADQEASDSQRLKPGDKYALLETPHLLSATKADALPSQRFLRAIPRRTAWGGGGLNLVNSVRDISPPSKTSDIRFTAVAPHWRFNYFVSLLHHSRDQISTGEPLEESAIQAIVDQIRAIGPDLNIVEWALARQRIKSLFLRDGFVEFLKDDEGHERLLLPPVNLAISRVRSGRVDLKDKIILKAPPPSITDSMRFSPSADQQRWETRVMEFISAALSDWTFPVLNSVKDAVLVRSLLSACHSKTAIGKGWYGLIAMTDTVQHHLDAFLVPANDPHIRSWHLVFNEGELSRFILRLFARASRREPTTAKGIVPLAHVESSGSELVKDRLKKVSRGHPTEDVFQQVLDELQTEKGIQKWGEMFCPIRHQVFYPEEAVALLSFLRDGLRIRERVYVTLGSVGSLCLDLSGEVWFVGVIEGPEPGHDTTGLGDCWTAAITLLEYHAARAAKYPDTAASEAWTTLNARDFLKIATAVAYCRFTNPVGRVFLPDLIRVLKSRYIPISKLFDFGHHAPGPIRWSFPDGKVQEIRENVTPTTAERAYSKVLEDIIPLS